VFVALLIQHAMLKRLVVNCGLPDSKLFFHIIRKMARFSKRKKGIEHKMRVLIVSTAFV
jgi:hypothetical protein